MVSAVGDHLGFANASHLHRWFVAEYGCTLAQYRRRASTTGRVQRVWASGGKALGRMAGAPELLHFSSGQPSDHCQ